MSKLLEVYERPLAHFGPQRWWPAETDFEVLVGAILTQRTTWRNSARALEKLKRVGLLDAFALSSASFEEVAGHIRCAGFFRQKDERLIGTVRTLTERHGGSLEHIFEEASTEELRSLLLSWRGVGPETADVVLLYAAHRSVFPIDIYTVRLVKRLGLGGGGYPEFQRLFESQLPADIRLYKEFHALIDKLGKSFCRSTPRCAPCPLRDICRQGASS